uniref:ZP domain-containing protein n=1 Tax=Dicentrarchus labrax TaxID=13489 RepID=A0A8P4GAX4_DICLA
MLDKPTAAARGFSLVQQGHLIQIGVPFGAEGGYRKVVSPDQTSDRDKALKSANCLSHYTSRLCASLSVSFLQSLVVNNVYKEMYVIFLLYEHLFSLLYEDGSSIGTRHRMLRVLDTPLLCRPPFSLDQTISDDQVFSVYLGNIPADVLLEEVRINGKQLLMSESADRGYSISSFVHINGTPAYKLRLPFEDAIVHWMYLGQGIVQYSIEINFTLTIMPQRDSYYHQTFITARVFNSFPTEITAQCSDRGITFSMVRPTQAQSLWEVGIDHEPLTSQLAAQRGYRLDNNPQRTILEVPVFSIGYIYEDIKLSNFYGTFKLLLRDSKTLEVQTSTSKRCLFKTQDMIVCSADGTMTVVTTPTSTWPTVQPERTTLLDPTCGPKQTDGSRVLFEFKLDSCGTRAMVGELYVVYENEILHDRQMIADGPNFISRESQFKLTVRCFYPLTGVARLSVDRIFTSGNPGFGSVKVFKSVKDLANTAQECSHQDSGNAMNTPTKQVHQTLAAGGVLSHSGVRPLPRPGPGHLISVPAGHNKLLYLQTLPDLNVSPPTEGPTLGIHQVPVPVSSHPDNLLSQTQDQHVFRLPNFPPRYDQLPGNRPLNLNTLSFNFENLGLTDNLASGSSSRTLDPLVVEKPQTDSGSSSQTQNLQGPNSLGNNVRHSALTWNQPTLKQNNANQDLQTLRVHLSSGLQELTREYEGNPDLSLYESTGGGMEMIKTKEIPGYRPHGQYDPPQLHQVLQPLAQYSPDHISNSELRLSDRDQTYVPTNAKPITSKNTVADLSVDSQGSVKTEPTYTATSQNLGKPPGSMERRNTETVQSRVQNIRVKPPSIFVSSGRVLNQKSLSQQAQISNPSQYATVPTAVSPNGNCWTAKQLPEHRGSNVRSDHVPERPGSSTLKQEHGIHIDRVRSDQTSVIRLTGLSPNQVQSTAETENIGQESASTQRLLQPTGESHIRVRLVPGLQGRRQTTDKLKLQNPTRGTSSFTPKSILNSPVNVRELTNPHSEGGAGFTGSHTGPNGFSSDLNIDTSDCGGQYGASVHQGIVRGKPFS